MRCPACGADVPEKSFCESCGTSFVSGVQEIDPKATVDRIFASVGLPSAAPQEGASSTSDYVTQAGDALGGTLPNQVDGSALGEPIKAPGAVYAVESFSGPDSGGASDEVSDHVPESFSVPERSKGRVAAIVLGVVAALAIGVAVFVAVFHGLTSGASSSTAEDVSGLVQSQGSAAAVTSTSQLSASSESTASSSGSSASSASSATSASASGSGSAGDSSASKSASSSASAAAASSSASAKSTVDPRCFDAKGNASLYLVCELDGKKMKEALEQNGYSWIAGASAWMTEAGAIVEVQDANGPFSEKKLNKLKKGAVGTPAVFVVMTRGYESPQEALEGMGKDVTVNDTAAFDADSDIAFARISGPSTPEMLVAITKTSGDQQTFLVFNEDAISSNMFTTIVGTSAGTTIDDIWKVVTK